MSKKEVVKLIVMVLTAITTALSAMYLTGCEALQCNGAWCYGKSHGEVVIVR